MPAGITFSGVFASGTELADPRGDALQPRVNLFNLHMALSPAISVPSQCAWSRSAIGTGRYELRPSGISGTAAGAGWWPASLVLRTGTPASGNSGSQTSFSQRGRWQVHSRVDAAAAWYVQSAEYGQTNLLTDDLVLTSGSPPSAIEVVLRNDVGTLSGTVTEHAGAEVPATIVAIPDGFTKALPQLSYYYPPKDNNAAPGEFVIHSLAPGDYQVFAFDHAESIEYANPDVLQNYASQAAHVTCLTSGPSR